MQKASLKEKMIVMQIQDKFGQVYIHLEMHWSNNVNIHYLFPHLGNFYIFTSCVCVCVCVSIYMCIYLSIYIYIYIHTHTHTHTFCCILLMKDVTQSKFLSNLNREFFFSLTSCHTKVKEPSLPYSILIARWRIVGFIPFPKILALCEMQTALSRNWTLFAVFISYHSNHYSMGTSHLKKKIRNCVNCSFFFCFFFKQQLYKLEIITNTFVDKFNYFWVKLLWNTKFLLFLFWGRKCYFRIAYAQNKWKTPIFSPNFAFVIRVTKFSNLSIFQNISGRFNTE